MAIVIGLPELIFSNNALTDALPYHRYASHNAGKRYISSAVPDRGICEGLDTSVTAWHAHEYRYQLHDVGVDKRGRYIFLGETMAKEDISGCDEVGMSDANIEDLNSAKWTYAVWRWHIWEESEGARRSWICLRNRAHLITVIQHHRRPKIILRRVSIIIPQQLGRWYCCWGWFRQDPDRVQTKRCCYHNQGSNEKVDGKDLQ